MKIKWYNVLDGLVWCIGDGVLYILVFFVKL